MKQNGNTFTPGRVMKIIVKQSISWDLRDHDVNHNAKSSLQVEEGLGPPIES
jgi:hypothetical protein